MLSAHTATQTKNSIYNRWIQHMSTNSWFILKQRAVLAIAPSFMLPGLTLCHYMHRLCEKTTSKCNVLLREPLVRDQDKPGTLMLLHFEKIAKRNKQSVTYNGDYLKTSP